MAKFKNPFPSPAPEPSKTSEWLDEIEDDDDFDLTEITPIVVEQEDGCFYVVINSWGYDGEEEPPSHPSLDDYMIEQIEPLKPKKWRWLNGENNEASPPVRCELIVEGWEAAEASYGVADESKEDAKAEETSNSFSGLESPTESRSIEAIDEIIKQLYIAIDLEELASKKEELNTKLNELRVQRSKIV